MAHTRRRAMKKVKAGKYGRKVERLEEAHKILEDVVISHLCPGASGAGVLPREAYKALAKAREALARGIGILRLAR